MQSTPEPGDLGETPTELPTETLSLESTPTEIPTQPPAETPIETPEPTPTLEPTPTETPTEIPLPEDFENPEGESMLLDWEGGEIVYTYDGDGNLVKSLIDNNTTYYPNQYYEKRMVDAQQTIFKYYFVGSARIALRENGTITWLLSDHLGSTSGSVNAAGALVSTMKYTAFGETRGTGSSTTDYRYTGQREEEEIGLYFYKARFFDPALSRFVQADKLVPDPGNTKSFDRYAYVFNNPICYTDPSGNLVCLDDGYCGGAGSTAYQNRIYANAITYLFQWRLQGAFTKKESNVIAQSGYDILSYAEGGLTWMRNNFGGTVFTHSAISSIALPNNPHVFGNMVVLTQNWVNSYKNPNQVIAHELGHVWDNKSSSSGLGTYIGGGVADKLYSFLSGIDRSPTGVRFWNPNKESYVDPNIELLASEDRFNVSGKKYGNGCTADYFAEVFSRGIYDPSAVPTTALLWMKSFISLGVFH